MTISILPVQTYFLGHKSDLTNAGPDGIKPIVMKNLHLVIAPTVQVIYQKSYTSHQTPDEWRQANVTPIYNKKEQDGPGKLPPSVTHVYRKQTDGACDCVLHDEAPWRVTTYSAQISMASDDIVRVRHNYLTLHTHWPACQHAQRGPNKCHHNGFRQGLRHCAPRSATDQVE